MSTDKFLNTAMRTSCAALCQAIGWNSVQSSALDVLSDVFQRYFLDIAKRTHRYAEHCGRVDANLDDAVVVFEEMNVSIPELEEYVQNFDPVPFPGSVPLFPLERESHLNFLRPGSQEVLTRPVHVHEYMPPMLVEVDVKLKRDKSSEDWQGTNSNMSVTSPDKPSVTLSAGATSVNGMTPFDIDGEMEVDEKATPLVNGKINGFNGNKDSKSEDEYESDGGPHSPLSSGISPTSPKSSKSAKRTDSPGENPALKRVRMMLEEEGHPLREITSVMMTTSGYLTSSREGRLPDSRPPPNRDFFEPLPVPVPDKKKKIPTMKKIVEGVKKIDKEKENQSDKGDSGFNLFEKPDKIFSSASAAAAAASSPAAAPSSVEKEKDKGASASGGVDGEVVSSKSKEGKEKSKEKKDKSEKSASKSEKKSKDKDENRDKQTTKKLKIFKKKVGNKYKLAKTSLKEKPVKVKIPKEEPNSGLDNIESDEDFGTPRSSLSREDSPTKKSRKNKKEKFVTPIRMKDKKFKAKLNKLNKLNKPPLAAITPPPTKISQKALQKAAAAAALAAEQVPIFGNPDKIVPVLIGAQKKKRGRPKKSASPFNVNFMGGLHGLEATPPPPPLPPPSIKSMKFSRKMLAAQEDLFVPEISINVKPPPPPDFALLHRLPLQPGLIPAPFVPPPNLKMPSQLPPSISITPATPTITPSSPAGSTRNSAQFGNLNPSACSSVTITRIDMSNSKNLPTPYDSQSTPGIGSPNLSNSMSISTSKSSASSAANIVPLQSDSGITITPIVLEKQSGSQSSSSSEKVDRPPAPSGTASGSGLAKLEQNMRSKEQRKKDKEKRKELKKEKKKERKEKLKEKSRKIEKLAEKEKEKEKEKDRDKVSKKEKKEKDKDKDKSEKKKKKDKDGTSTLPLEATVPKLTLKLQHSSTTTPVDSPNPPPAPHDTVDHLPPRKITIKPIEEAKAQRTPSPELARFSPLVTRPSKKVSIPKKSPPVIVAKAPKQQEVVSFPPTPAAGATPVIGSSKRGRGRPPKSAAKAPSKSSSGGSSTQAGLVTETVGSYIDEHGNKIWICPACGRQDDGSPMIGCEKCDDWYHFLCVGIVEAPAETESWYCKKCVVVKNKPSNFDHRKKVSRL